VEAVCLWAVWATMGRRRKRKKSATVRRAFQNVAAIGGKKKPLGREGGMAVSTTDDSCSRLEKFNNKKEVCVQKGRLKGGAGVFQVAWLKPPHPI